MTASSTLSLSADTLPLGPGVRLIDHNEDGLVALDKPAGILSHPNSRADRDHALLQADYDYEAERYDWEDEAGSRRQAWLINRLDSPTSGVILLALDPDLNLEVKRHFATHHVTKIYYAVVRHAPSVPAGVWHDSLSKTVYRNGRAVKGAKRVSAKARYQIVKEPTGGFPVCLLKLMPLTGRTHQLRVQCARHRHPIVGDRTYGNFAFNREVAAETGEERMLLHSVETIVNYAFRGRQRTFTARSELPDAFDSVLGFRPGVGVGRPRGRVAGRRFRRP